MTKINTSLQNQIKHQNQIRITIQSHYSLIILAGERCLTKLTNLKKIDAIHVLYLDWCILHGRYNKFKS